MSEDMTRRQFLETGISAGFALAVMPVTAWAITTSSEGIEAGSVTIPTTGGSLPAYRAFPKKAGKHPVVIVVHEIFGVHEYIQDVCRRLAHEGYYAIAPYLYFREGDVTKITDFKKIVGDVVSKVPQSQVLSDLDATVKWAGAQKGADAARVGITGFCWGGNAVWMYAAHNPSIKAGVAWYGRLNPDANPLNPKKPLDIAGDLKVPVLGLYGGKDEGIPQTDVAKMREALAKGHSDSKIIVYPEAEHGFHADYRPSYDEKAAKEGWSELLKWFRAHKL